MSSRSKSLGKSPTLLAGGATVRHDLLARDYPTRSRPWPVISREADELWSALRSALKDLDLWRAGAGQCVPSLGRPLRRILRELESAQLPAPWSVDEAATLLLVSGCDNLSNPGSASLALEMVLAIHGLTFTIEALLASEARSTCALGKARWLARPGEPSRLSRRPHQPWLLLRSRAAASPESEYQNALHEATRLRARGELKDRCRLAFVFPDQDWGKVDLEEALTHPQVQYGRNAYLDAAYPLLVDNTELSIARELLEKGGAGLEPDLLPSILFRLGPPAAPLLVGLLKRDGKLKEYLHCLPYLETALALKDLLLDHKQRAPVLEFYEAYPGLGLQALAQVVHSGGKAAELARPILHGMLAAHAGLVANLPERERTLCESLLAKRARRLPEAPADLLPSWLTVPPWKGQKVTRKPLVKAGMPLQAYEEKLHWRQGRPRPYIYQVPPPRGADLKRCRELEDAISAGSELSVWQLDGVCDETALRLWCESDIAVWRSWDLDSRLLHLLARFDLAGIPTLLALVERDLSRLVETVEVIESPRVALLMARAMRMSSRARVARGWFQRYPRAAALGLLPYACGPAGKDRDDSEAAVRYLSQQGHRELLREVARGYGALEALEEILSFDPLHLYPARLPKLPDFCKVENLTPPTLADRQHTLSAAAMETLLQMLAFSTPDAPYLGVELVRQLCEPQSLEALAWELFSGWLAAGAPAKEKWAFFALGAFGGDESARRLAPMIRAWPQESAFARAEMGLDVLCGIGTDVALMHLYGMSQKLKSKALQQRARERLDQVSARRGLSTEELSDRLVPDLDLEADGTRLLDFGPRQFRLTFDEHLRPVILASDGKPIKDLPRATQKDDARLAAEAHKTYKALKKDAKAICSIQLERLEQAMASGRRWSWESFRLLFLAHPLLIHPVRRLVWEALDQNGEPRGTFRVAEDTTLAGPQDELFEALGQDVRIAHPLRLDRATLQAWVSLFNDYDIVQPFAQLGRPVHRWSDGKATEIGLAGGWKAHPGKVLSLLSRGWRKGPIWDSGVLLGLEKELPGSLKAVLGMEPGIYAGDISESGEQTLKGVTLLDPFEKAMPVERLQEVVYSELIHDLETLRPGGRS